MASITRKLLIVGAGGHGLAAAEAAYLSRDFEVVGFVDDARPVGESLLGPAVLGPTGELPSYRFLADCAIVAIGNNSVREVLTKKVVSSGYSLGTVVHPRAVISESAVIGSGAVVLAGAIVCAQARLGMGVIVNCGAVVDHHAQVGDFGHLGVNACMAGGSVLGRGAWLQAGAAVGSGIRISAGAVVL